MIAMLVLITVFMQRAKDPQVYERAFSNLGVPLQPEPSRNSQLPPSSTTSVSVPDSANAPANANAAATPPSLSIESDLATSQPNQLIARIWLTLLGKATPATINELAIATFASHRVSNLSPDSLAWLEVCQRSFEPWQAEAPEEYSRFEPFWRETHEALFAGSMADLEENRRQAWEQALETAMLPSLRDDAPWRAIEYRPLHRLLQRAKQHWGLRPDQAPPLINPSDLTAQPEYYRGQVVQWIGRIVQGPTSEKLVDEACGDLDYWVAWVKPLDGSRQPICVYLAEPLESSIPESGSVASESPTMAFTGVFAKRLTYAAQNDVASAPVVICSQAKILDGPQASNNGQNGIEQSILPLLRLTPWRPQPERSNLRTLSQTLESPLQSLMDQPTWLGSWLDQDAKAIVPVELLQLLFQLQRFPETLAFASEKQLPVADQPVERLQGMAVNVHPISLAPSNQEWFGAKAIYRVTIESDSPTESTPITRTLITPLVPTSWLNQAGLRQPIEVSAIRFQPASANDASNTSDETIFIAAHLRWRGTIPHPSSPEISELWRALAESGWDLQQVDVIRRFQKKNLSESEANPFYSLLDYCRVYEPPAIPSLTMTDLIAHPDQHLVAEVRLTLDTYRISKVQIAEGAHSTAYPFDHYFQIDGMASLDRAKIRFIQPTNPEQPVVFEGRFPVSLVTAQIPDWLQAPRQSIPTSWEMRKSISVSGIYYRFWEYASGRVDKQSDLLPQISPLIFAQTLKPIPPPSPTTVQEQLLWFGSIIGGCLLITLVAMRWTRRKKSNRLPPKSPLGTSPNA